ncbi:MAG: carbamoyltransferase HypF [Pseudomonadota bacterium]
MASAVIFDELVRSIRVRGCVQGVGYRPFVWQLANRLGLRGEVSNDGEGVFIAVGGPVAAVEEFTTALRCQAPPLARVERVEVNALVQPLAENGFTIVASTAGQTRTAVASDAATCDACLAEVLDPTERRHGYALTNCTHCGPRLSIIAAMPYDRANTSMARFAMCADCRREYADPSDRRFHAQPIACPACGPQLRFADQGGSEARDPIAAAAQALRAGKIVAVKGIGGYHLACLADNEAVVGELRRRKSRDAKPFAVMMPSLDMTERFCLVDPAARSLLASTAAPIVVLPLRGDAGLPGSLAPGLDTLGVMLPYTPLHHLLLAAVKAPMVMTSGNCSDEPQVTDDAAAREHLAGLADGWLWHDREILHRLDDSVVAPVPGGRPMVLRRARGMAPAPLALHGKLASARPILAMGGDLKATFCILRGEEAIVSQHFGDLADATAFGDYRKMIALYRELYDFTPEIVAVDAHADYHSARVGRALAGECGAELVTVSHHHAHLAACLADNAVDPDEIVLGVICDGLGMGADGTLWGGEVLRGYYARSERIGSLPAVALPGGNAAMKQPWRNLVAHLRAAGGDGWNASYPELTAHLPDRAKVDTIEQAITRGINAPPCSSAGRLFDAVAAALGVYPDRIGYEGQAAMALEALARPAMADARIYPINLARDCSGHAVLELAEFWSALAADLRAGVEHSVLAANFHATFAEAMVLLITAAKVPSGTRVVLSGGVMQNALVVMRIANLLCEMGLQPLVHRAVPAGDGGLSLGQAANVAAIMAERAGCF